MMIVENLFSFFFGVIMTYVAERSIGGNKEFFRILNDFRKKLPPKDKTAIIDDKAFSGLTHMKLDTLKPTIDRKDLDNFLKELEDFDYESIYFRKAKILRYSKNLQRIVKTGSWDLFTIGILQELLENKNRENDKPYIFGLRTYKYIKC